MTLKLRYIKKFRLQKIMYEESEGTFKDKGIHGSSCKISINANRDELDSTNYIAEFPVIIKEDGKIWELGMQFLLLYFQDNYDISGSTIKNIANDLFDFYKFSVERNIDIFNFPELIRKRITFLYRSYLIRRVNENQINEIIADRKMLRALKFYNAIIQNELVDLKLFENKTKKEILDIINIQDTIDSNENRKYISRRLKIKNTRQNDVIDEIKDYERLTPLAPNQLDKFLFFLKESTNIEFRMIAALALLTGARKQTIGTIRVYHIEQLVEKQNNSKKYYKLAIGGKSGIDTKNGTKNFLYIHKKLINQILIYIKSSAWEQRARKNPYGLTNQNYIFLTRSGRPYYTRKKEMEDHRDFPKSNWPNIRQGQSININLEYILKEIRKKDPQYQKFKFHDLRATFAKKNADNFIKAGYSLDNSIEKLRILLGHSKSTSSEKYINYTNNLEIFIKTQESFEEMLFGEETL